MSPRYRCFAALFAFSFFSISNASAVTLSAGQTNYITPGNITTSGIGISSTLVGTNSAPNKIKNTFTITTGNSGATSSAYGIKVVGNYNQVTNDVGAAIITTANSGRGISVVNLATVENKGSINTQGTTSYGIYLGGNNDLADNSGSIKTLNTTSYGIYSDGNNNIVNNSGTITTAKTYGIYVSAGSSSIASPAVFNSVNNSGIINSFSHGIYTKDGYTQINNSGTISSGAASDVYGIITEGDNSSITNSGTINSARYAIYNSGTNVVINNSGNLNGAVHIDDGVLNILGGTINGEVNSGGAATVNVGDASHNSIIFNQTTNFSNLGLLNIGFGSTFNSHAELDVGQIFIDQNSTLILSSGSVLSAPILGSSNLVGALTIDGISFSPTSAIGAFGNSLKNLNIISAASLDAVSDIYADNIFLNGALNLDVNIFGSLAGSGSATIDVGLNNQNISGNFSLLSGDVFSLSLANGASGSLAIGGIASIDSNIKLKINTAQNHNYIASGSKFEIVKAANGSSINQISAANISVNESGSNIFGLLRVRSSSTSTSLVINIDHLKAEEITPNKNAQNIYRSLDESGANSFGAMRDFQIYLDNSGFSGDKVTQALNQLAPQSTKAALATTTNLANNSISILERKLENFSERMWVQPFGIFTHQNVAQDDNAYSANSRGIAFGASEDVSDKGIAGAALSIARSDIKSADNLQQNMINSYQVNFYRRQNFEKFFIEGITGFALHNYVSTRAIKALTLDAKAEYSGQTYIAKSRIGATKKLHRGFEITPDISFSFLRNNISGYSEKGADSLNLSVQKISADFFEGRLGMNFGWSGKAKEVPEFKKFSATTKISYGHAFINDAPTTVAKFSGSSENFTSRISQMDNNSLKIGLLLEALHQQATAFSGIYNFEHKATAQTHLFAVNIRQEF